MNDIQDSYQQAVGRLTLAAARMEILLGELARASGAPSDAVSFLSTSGISGGPMQMLQTAGQQLPPDNEINALHRDAAALLIERDAMVHAVTIHGLGRPAGTASGSGPDGRTDLTGVPEAALAAPLPPVEALDDLVERLDALSAQSLRVTRLTAQGVVDPITTEEQP